MNNYKLMVSVFGLVLMLNCHFLFSQENNKLKFYGDFRFRAEIDRDSEKMDGTMRDDRDRFRYRLRAGFSYVLNKNMEFGGRIRTGNPQNQQSPHVTLGKEFHSDEFFIDRAYLKLNSNDGYWASFGKNAMPLWQQNGLLWNDDVNPEGISVGKQFKLNSSTNLTPVGGYFIVGNSGNKFTDDSKIIVGQLKLNSMLSGHKLTVATGMISASKLPNTPDATQTFMQDYAILASNIQLIVGKYSIGFDYFSNLKNYDNVVAIPTVFKDQKTGYAASFGYGIKKISIGYTYANIEKFAVINYFAQDDWLRWGNDNMTSSSNFKGHELALKYTINSNFNAVFRAFKVEGIKTTGTNLETGTRVRLDLNIKL